MKRLAVVVLMFAVSAWAQQPAPGSTEDRLRRLERDVQSLQFSIEQAEQQSLETAFMLAAQGVARYDVVRYTNPADNMVIPAHLWTPLNPGNKKLPALVWVHGGVHGHLDFYYWKMIRDMLEQGYVVLAPEYRGSTHHGEGMYRAIDYGGLEVEDCIAGRDWLAEMHPNVDPARIGIIGWSHGGFIVMHALYRQPQKFKVGVNVVGVSDLVERMGYSTDNYRRIFAEQKGFGGPPSEKLQNYINRSPAHLADKLQTPLLLHGDTNDQDVRINEQMHLIDALKAAGKKFEYQIYQDPPGGHSFNRIDTQTAADSWGKCKAFLNQYLK
jgi:dipeptidyl aminopeptidase/acylaminoacyl peptidase